MGAPDDLPGLKALGLLSFGRYREVLSPDNWALLEEGLNDEARLRALMRQSAVFVCAAGETLAGVAYLVPSGHPEGVFAAEWSYIRRVSVHPGWQGRGIARELTRRCINHARAAGEQVLTLHTSEFMDAARHIYESLGFRREREIDPIFGKRYWLYRLDLI
jgi:ribosomal protein S18 acetylase RimI-like enzyme